MCMIAVACVAATVGVCAGVGASAGAGAGGGGIMTSAAALKAVQLAQNASRGVRNTAPMLKNLTGKVGSKINISTKNPSNLFRIGKGRISFGPAPSHYGSGRSFSKIPIHIHIERGKFLIQKSKTGKVIRCWGKKCW